MYIIMYRLKYLKYKLKYLLASKTKATATANSRIKLHNGIPTQRDINSLNYEQDYISGSTPSIQNYVLKFDTQVEFENFIKIFIVYKSCDDDLKSRITEKKI